MNSRHLDNLAEAHRTSKSLSSLASANSCSADQSFFVIGNAELAGGLQLPVSAYPRPFQCDSPSIILLVTTTSVVLGRIDDAATDCCHMPCCLRDMP